MLAGRRQRLLRSGLLLYALVLFGAFVVSSAVGGNAARLGALLGGPVAALILLRRDGDHFARGRLWLLVGLAPLMALLAGEGTAGGLPGRAGQPVGERLLLLPAAGGAATP